MSDDKKINWHPPMQMPESNPVIQFTQKVKHPEKIKINFKLPQWKLKNRNSSLDITLSPAAKKLYNEWRTVLEEEAKIEAVNKPKYYKSDPDISKKYPASVSSIIFSARKLNVPIFFSQIPISQSVIFPTLLVFPITIILSGRTSPSPP